MEFEIEITQEINCSICASAHPKDDLGETRRELKPENELI